MNRLIFLVFFTFLYSLCLGQNLSGNLETPLKGEKTIPVQASFKKNNAASDYIGIYQKYISGIRGQECPMYPSCSYYGLKVFSEKSFATAFALTSDRLLRCGHDHNKYFLTLRPNGFKYLDYPSYDPPPLDLYYSRNSYVFAYSDTTNDRSPYVFIKKLMNNQYHQEALLEIMRMEFSLNTFDIELFINKIICLQAIGEYEKALFEFETKCPKSYQNHPQLLFHISLIHYKLQNFDQALLKNAIAHESCNDRYLRPKLILLEGLLYANKFDWHKAIDSYGRLIEYEMYKEVSANNVKLLEKAKQLKQKSPALAGIISIIPGAGYAYTGHKQTALSAFLVNGLLSYATYTSFKNENYGMGLLTGVFNASFYIGNIFGASNSAKRFNEQQKKSIINTIEFNSNL